MCWKTLRERTPRCSNLREWVGPAPSRNTWLKYGHTFFLVSYWLPSSVYPLGGEEEGRAGKEQRAFSLSKESLAMGSAPYICVHHIAPSSQVGPWNGPGRKSHGFQVAW
jgi:hypothetical protein